ncbi:hypothetical protein [Cecembia sp.]|uniref:hypothetical protein n=1 Tax=Cecembia sp. TaxID=1898110 RepID=UPI0025C435EB|nr:hypothetical protein [Cecembia sp.]
MKNRILCRVFILIFLFNLFYSCTDRKNKDVPISNQKAISFQDLETGEKILENEIPYTKENLERFVPEKIGDFSRTKLISGYKDAASMNGILGVYQKDLNKSKLVTIEILDGAGNNGSVLLQAAEQRLDLDYEEKSNTGFTKIYRRNQNKVRETERSIEKYAEIEFIYNERFLFIFKGQMMSVVDLWEFVKLTELE